MGEPDLTKTILSSPLREEFPILPYASPGVSFKEFSTLVGSVGQSRVGQLIDEVHFFRS